MKKNRLWKKKGYRYGAAGTLCLMLAVGLFVLMGMGIGTQAAELNLGNISINLDQDASGNYLIKTADDMLKLGQATSGTSGIKFVLNNDITIPSITSAAAGMFEGTFDGNGKVITIQDINITDSTLGEVSQGLLFGTVSSSGKVQNLIVDIESSVRYSRTSKVERSDTIAGIPDIEVDGTAQQPTDTAAEGFNIYEGTDTQKNLAAKFNDDANQNDVDTVEVDGKQYRRETKTEDIVKTVSYAQGAAGDDYFGILCGTLGAGGALDRVYVKGAAVNVEQYPTLVSLKTTQKGEREHYFYYEIGNKDVHVEQQNKPTGTVSDYSVTVFSGSALSEVFEEESNSDLDIKVTSAKYIEKGGIAEYEVYVKNNTVHELQFNITPSANLENGSWTDSLGQSVTDWTLLSGKDVTYKYSIVNLQNDLTGTFKVTYTYITSETVNVEDVNVTAGVSKTNQDDNIQAIISGLYDGSDTVYTISLNALDAATGTIKLTDISCTTENTSGILKRNGEDVVFTDLELTTDTQVYTYTVSGSKPEELAFNVGYNLQTTTGDPAQITSELKNLSIDSVQAVIPVEKNSTDNKLSLTAKGEKKDETIYQYTLTLTNTTDKDITELSLTPTDNGEWTDVTSDMSLSANIPKTFTYSSTADNVSFSVSGMIYTENPKELSSKEISTNVVDITETGSESTSPNGLSLALKPLKKNYLTTGSNSVDVFYELTITNNSDLPDDANDLQLTVAASDITGSDITWYEKDGSQTNSLGNSFTGEKILGKDDSCTLIGVMTVQDPVNESGSSVTNSVNISVSVSKSTAVYNDVTHYTYAGDNFAVSDMNASNPKYGEEDYGTNPVEETTPDTYNANHLSAGIFAGFSNGTITNSKQEMPISGTKDANIPANVTQQIGGAVGAVGNTASASALYLKRTGTYAGNQLELPENSTNSTGDMPLGDGWSSYTKYESGASAESAAKTYFDLSWLVKKESAEEQYFTYDTPAQDKVNVTVSSYRPVSSYAIAYNARKAIEGTSESDIHVATKTEADPTLDLGNSGFYRILSAYATDGYYHYCTDAKELSYATIVYPYDETNIYHNIPYNDDNKWDTTSTDNKIIFNGFPTSGNMEVYYIKNGAKNDIPTDPANKVSVSEGKILLDFTEEQVSYRLVLVADGRIYLTSAQKSFDSSDRKALPKPVVTYQSGYSTSGDEIYQTFTSGVSMQSGQKLKISMENDVNSYNFQYLLSRDVLGEDTDWETDGRYIGTNAALLSSAQNYGGSISLSDTGTYHLYVKVSRKNYRDAIYRYGQLTVTDAVELTSSIYYTENDLSDIQNEGIVVDGDLIKLQSSDDSYNLKYEISSSHKTDNYTWTSYEKGSFIPLEQAGKSAVYVYVAACKGDNSLERIQEFHYTFSDSCLPVSVTPNTGQETEGDTGAAPVESGSTVKLSTRTENARILYSRPGSSTDFILERVTDLPSGVQDETVRGGYKYYQAGSRWYRTSLTDMQVYSSEIILSNTEATLMRIYAVVLKDGFKPAEGRKYIYSVAAQQQVAAPEASLTTRKQEDADNVAATMVELGSSLMFSSMTPGVTLYYRLPGQSVWTELPSSGVEVTGTYDAKYTISVQAKKEGMLDSNIVTYEYLIASQESVMVPTATPSTATDAPAVVMPGSKILLSSMTKGATIYYTLDGSAPHLTENADGSYQAAEGTLLYEPEKGIVIPEGKSGLFTICAVAVKSGLAKSEEVHLVYTFPDAVVTPYANVSQGYVALDTEVHLKNKTEDAVIYYTVGYGDEIPEEPTLSSAVYDDAYPFVITKKTTIRAFAAKGGVKSGILELTYVPMEELSVPVPSIESGSIVSRGTVLTLKAADGATIYYTMDGSDPLDSANKAVVSGTTIALNGEGGSQITIKAYAAADDKSASEVVTFTYQFSQSAGGVTADVETGSLVSNGTKVNLMTDVSGAEIHYTTDGSSPAESGTKGTTVTVNGVPGSSFTIKAVAVVDGEAGVVAAFTYKIKEIPNAPTATPAGGTLTVAARVTLSSGSEKIYYTTDGTTPTESSSLYSEPILINRTTTLKAIAVSKDGESSEVASWQYVAAARAEAPSANLADMSVLEPGTIVLLRTETPDAEIYYSTDGTVPTLTDLDSMLLYQEDGITISRSVTIKAVAYREDLQLSNVGVWNYVVEKIPAVEIRVQKEAKLAEEELRDTDSSGLDRDTAVEGTAYKSRVLEDDSCGTVVSSDWESIAPQTKLATEKVEISSATVNNVKKMFGEDHTVLASYDMKLIHGSTYVKPNGDVEIGIPIPEGYENAVLTIASVDSEHRLKACETRRSGDMLYAATDQMNQFVVIGVEELESEDASSFHILDWFMAICKKISAKW